MRIGDKIRKLRETRGLAQTELAIKAGISQKTVSKIERNLSEEPKTLPAIARALDMSLDELMRGVIIQRVASVKEKKARYHVVATTARSKWPFDIRYQRFNALTADEKAVCEGELLRLIAGFEQQRQLEKKRAS